MAPKTKKNYKPKGYRFITPNNVRAAASAAKAGINTYRRVKKYNIKKPKSIIKGFGELSVNQYKYGKSPRQNLKQAWKEIKSNEQQNINYYEACNRYMANPTYPGAQLINYVFYGSNQSGQNGQPLHLYSLSATPQIVGGTITNPAALNVLRRSDISTSSYVNFGTFGNYQIQNTSGPSNFAQSFAGQQDILKSVSINMVLYGSVTRPIKYLIQMVQFRKPYLHPDYINAIVANSGTPINQPEISKATAFYDELTKQYVYSPISFSDNTQYKDMKVMKSWVHVIQPALSTERVQVESETSGAVNQAMPHSKIVKIFYKLNRRQRYNWDDSIQPGLSTSNTTDTVPVIAGANKLDTTYNARVYLMVRALSPICTYNGSYDSAAQASYDIAIREYHCNLG